MALFCAAVPALVFVQNLRVFGCPAQSDSTSVSVLIPARDEAANIADAVKAALANPGIEVVVLDDGSTDATATIVSTMVARDPRVRLLKGQPLPAGWCGKNFACYQLAEAAKFPVLLFVDADVRLARDGVGRTARALRASRAHLISGVPRQQVGTFSELLFVPLIQWLLLGFLPLSRMRQSLHPAYATACGQLIMVDGDAYRQSGGHSAARSAIHDGLALPKVFRQAGFRTDLFDATAVATCRMYHRNREVWSGLLKNTHEGLGAPTRILPITLLLIAGQVLPFVLLTFWSRFSGVAQIALVTSVILALVPRLLAKRRFHQSLASVFLHPVAIISLLGIQWLGLFRFIIGTSARWRGREYRPA